jgi:drug/metabolite transporter (DMT)-like permease
MDKENKQDLFAMSILLITAIIWGGGFVATRNGLDHIKPFYLQFLRFSIAFLLLSSIFFKKLKQITKEDLKGGLIVGIFLFTAFSSQTIGLQYTTPSKQAFLTGTNVVMVPFLYWFVFKKKPDIFSYIGVFLSFIGISVLTYEGGVGINLNLGDILTLLCALLYAAHIVSTGHFAKNIDPVILSIIQFGLTAILSLIFALIFEPVPTVYNKTTVFSVLYLGVFSSCIAFLFQTIGQKYTSSTKTAIILSTESVFGTIFSVILLHDKFTLNMFIGCMLIFISILAVETKFGLKIEPKGETASE